MAAIRGRDTKPELIIRKGLHARGFRFRLQGSDLPGRPDLIFPKYNALLWVHGKRRLRPIGSGLALW